MVLIMCNKYFKLLIIIYPKWKEKVCVPEVHIPFLPLSHTRKALLIVLAVWGGWLEPSVTMEACWLLAMRQDDVFLLIHFHYQCFLHFDVLIKFVFARLPFNWLTIPNAGAKWLGIYAHVNCSRLEDAHDWNLCPIEGRSWFNHTLVNICLHEHVTSIRWWLCCQEVNGAGSNL